MATPFMLTGYAIMDQQDGRELPAATAVFGEARVSEFLYEIPPGSVVIPRYRALPFGDLLQQEVEHGGSVLINTHRQQRAIADSSTWAHLLDGSDGRRALSARQYGLGDIPHLPEGEWFVKGETNSIKNNWLESAYAPTTGDLTRVIGAFLADSYVGHQSVVIKPFQRYRRLATGLNSQPIFHERRVFVLDGQVLADGFYWSSWEEELGSVTYDEAAYHSALAEAIERTKHLARFYVVDMAEYEDGHWGVVELNDGCMAGLSAVDPYRLWTEFHQVCKR